jgi:hypothetical protein
MKISELALAFGLLLHFLAAAPEAPAQEGTGQTWVWTTPEPPIPGRHLSLTVSRIEDGETDQVIHFDCAIQSTVGYNNSRVVFELSDTAGVLVGEGEERLNVLAGANQSRIAFDASALPLGTYRARFYLTNPQLPGEPTHSFIFRKVNDRNLLEQLAASRTRLDAIEAALRGAETTDGSLPYLRVKASVAADVLRKAEENSQAGEWESLERRLSFVTNRLDAIRASMIFGASASERLPKAVDPRLDGLSTEQGGFSAQGRPVFLFGAALPTLDAESIAHLRRYQLNAATVTVGREEIPGASQSPSVQVSRLRDVFDAAVAHNVSVMVQLAPEQVSPAFLTAHPDVKHEGQVDIGRPEVRAEWEAFLAQVAPALNGQPMLAGISIANDPHFRFDGPGVRDGFLEHIRANYPDRLTLNRSWRSHLATYEEIVPWSTDPLDSYQAHRPYQFDWQTYHMSLGNAYFDWARRVVESQLPGAALSATMSDALFAKGETRHGLNRERLSALLDFSGCSAEVAADDPIYAMGYPNSSAYYTLLKSFQPGKPVFNLYNVLSLGAHAGSVENYRFVHAALWESVISGLNGATVPMDSLLFQQPEALEGFATAALDINRLAPIVRAIQNAPTDVGILFSYASKVFDDGDPHLESAINAYEGAAFGGYNVRYITEEQCVNGALEGLKILVLPNTPALGDGAFHKIAEFVEAGGTVARTGTPIPYNERGFSRGDLIRNTGNTVLVRGLNLPTEYLHAMDAATVLGALPQIPRAITPQGYPVEGVKTRYVEYEGGYYIYMVNMRKEPVSVALATPVNRGRDLIQSQDVEFPATLEPLVPRLIKLEPVDLEMKVTVAADEAH